MADVEPSFNLPSLLTLAVVSFLVIRWLLSSRSSSDSGGLNRLQQRGRRVDPAHVEQISQMFPQLNRRDIMWDLHRNGGSVAATTERILTGRGLETPPPSYQPQLPPATTARTSIPAVTAAQKAYAENLITRYKLESRIAAEKANRASSDESTSKDSKSAWSQNRTERQRLLQKRRDDMILAARRKLMEKESPRAS